MITSKDFHTLISRQEKTENVVLTVYLDVDQTRQTNLNRGFQKQLNEMLRSLREGIRNNHERNAFDRAAQAVERFVSKYPVGARGLTLISDASDEFFFANEVEFPIRNEIRWGREAFLAPLAVACDEYERVGIVLVDRARMRLLTLFLGEIEEIMSEEFDRQNVRHTKTVGTDHWSSASQAQRKADEQIRANLRYVRKQIDALVEKLGIARIVLAGSSEMTAELKTILPKRLASQIIGVVDLDTKANANEIRIAGTAIAEKFERESEEIAVTGLLAAAKSVRVVTGLGHTLNALNQRRVWQLVYVDGFHAPGYECWRCGALYSLETKTCSLCGSDTIAVPNIVERTVDHALKRGAKIEVIRSEVAEESLSNAGGIGAFLRTRTPSAASTAR